MTEIPTHCSKCGDKLKPIHMNSGLVRGGWYTAPGSKDPLCPKCAEEASG